MKCGNEKVVGVLVCIWIVSWFLAIWICHLQLFLTGLLAFFLASLGVDHDDN